MSRSMLISLATAMRFVSAASLQNASRDGLSSMMIAPLMSHIGWIADIRQAFLPYAASSASRIAPISAIASANLPSMRRLTTALPTMTASLFAAAATAASGEPMPKPTASGVSVNLRAFSQTLPIVE